jgi:hypothetical protein
MAVLFLNIIAVSANGVLQQQPERTPIANFSLADIAPRTTQEQSNGEINRVVPATRYTTATEFYASVMNSEEFKNTENHFLRRQMLQLPENLIARMDTEALLDAVLAYPFFREIYAFTDVNIGVKLLFSDFNGAIELANRPDVAHVLLRKYENTAILSHNEIQAMDAVSVGDAVYALSNIEILLAQDFVIQRLDADEISKLNNVVYERFFQKLESPEYGTTTTAFYATFESLNRYTLDESQVAIPSAALSSVTTPNGSLVSVFRRGEELSTAQILSNHQWVATNFPGATWLGQSTTHYNCHSYTWHWQSTSNRYWMNNPIAYVTDGSYRQFPIPWVGDKMIWVRNGLIDHSANVTTVLHGPPHPVWGYTDLVRVTSKWGSLGLYSHNGMHSPYWFNGTFTTFFAR